MLTLKLHLLSALLAADWCCRFEQCYTFIIMINSTLNGSSIVVGLEASDDASVMSLLIWYSPIPSYFHLFITLLLSLILHHAPHQWNLPHDLHKPLWPPSTIPYTHCTTSPAPHFRFDGWPMYHTALFPFWVTQCTLSQAIMLHGQGLITSFTAHETCARFSLSFVFKLLVFTT